MSKSFDNSSNNNLFNFDTNSIFGYLSGLNHVGIAVSGGSDSMALLTLYQQWIEQNRQKKLPIPIVITIEHGLRKESAAEAKFVAKHCHDNNLKHHILEWKHENNIQQNIQETARCVRYELIEQFLNKHNTNQLLTAHHMSDQIETFFMRLLRGSGPYGLASILPICRINDLIIHRPLLKIRKENLINFLQKNHITWFEDQSNYEEKYHRTRIRQMCSAMEKSYGSIEKLNTSINKIATQRLYLDQEIMKMINNCVIHHKAGYILIDLKEIKKTTNYIAIEQLLALCLQTVGGQYHPPRYSKIKRLQELIFKNNQPSFKITLHKCIILKTKSTIWIIHEPRNKTPPDLDLTPYIKQTWENRFDIESYDTQNTYKARIVSNQKIKAPIENKNWVDQNMPQQIVKIICNTLPLLEIKNNCLIQPEYSAHNDCLEFSLSKKIIVRLYFKKIPHIFSIHPNSLKPSKNAS